MRRQRIAQDIGRAVFNKIDLPLGVILDQLFPEITREGFIVQFKTGVLQPIDHPLIGASHYLKPIAVKIKQGISQIKEYAFDRHPLILPFPVHQVKQYLAGEVAA